MSHIINYVKYQWHSYLESLYQFKILHNTNKGKLKKFQQKSNKKLTRIESEQKQRLYHFASDLLIDKDSLSTVLQRFLHSGDTKSENVILLYHCLHKEEKQEMLLLLSDEEQQFVVTKHKNIPTCTETIIKQAIEEIAAEMYNSTP